MPQHYNCLTTEGSKCYGAGTCLTFRKCSILNETIEIMGLALTNKAIDKYFQFFSRLDNGSKKKLIIKLTEFIEEKESTTFRIKDLAGAREDLRDSDDIIKDIIDSKENKGDNPAPLH